MRAARAGGQLQIAWVQPGGWAWDAGVRPGDLIIAVDGQPTDRATSSAAVATARAITARPPSGEVIEASMAEAATALNHYRQNFLGLALAFALVGAFVFVLAADLRIAGAILACMGTWSLILIAAVATPAGHLWAFALVYAALLALGFSTLLTFLLFPIDRMRGASGRWTARFAAGATLALLIAYTWAIAARPAVYAVVQPITYALVAAELLAASALVIGAWVVAPARSEVRQALGLLALGIAAGVLPFGLLSLAPRLAGAASLVPPEVAILSAVFLPLSLAAAALSRQFLGISRLVRRGLVALVVWLGLVGAYSLGLGALLSARAAPAPGLLVAGVAVMLGTFPPLEQRLRAWLDRALFRDVYDFAPTLHALSAEIARLPDAGAVAYHTLDRLSETLDLSWAALAVVGDGPLPEVYCRGDCPSDVAALLAGDISTVAPRGAVVPDDRPALLVPLTVERVAIGTLAVGPKRRDIVLAPEDAALLATLAPVLAATLQHRRLVRQLEGKVAALAERERELAALSGRLMRAQEDERRVVALDLHDDPLQRAVLLARDLGDAPRDPVAARASSGLEEIVASLQAICANLRPPALDNFGLTGGLERLVSDLRVRADGVVITLGCKGDKEIEGARLPRDLETALYRVAQEALNNCLKHAEATRIAVTLRCEGRCLVLRVADDGRGYHPEAAAGNGGRSLQLGLVGMRERLRPWGGTVNVASNVGVARW